MAKIVQVLTRPSEEYDLGTAEAQVRDLDGIIQKLNSIKNKIEMPGIDEKIKDVMDLDDDELIYT